MTNSKSATLFQSGAMRTVEDVLAVEEALHISVNGEAFTVTMRTPGFEEDLVAGLLYTEEVYRDKQPLNINIVSKNEKGFVTSVDVQVPQKLLLKDFAMNRNIVSASSCGLCGRTSFDETLSQHKIENQSVFPASQIPALFETMRKSQADFSQSGGTHAAAAFSLSGEMIGIREDIGRHNAVDKLIGSLIRTGRLSDAVCMTVSGRLSYEIVNKATSAGIPILASVSAPSTMAVEHAQQNNMTLVAFCRDQRFTVYAHPERILMDTTLLTHT